MVTSIIREVFVTDKGEEFDSKFDAERQEIIDQVYAEIEPELSEDGEQTVADIIRLISFYFTLTPIPHMQGGFVDDDQPVNPEEFDNAAP